MRCAMAMGRHQLFTCCLYVIWLSVRVNAEPLQLGDGTFQESIDSGKVHFVKFYAPWSVR